MSQDQKTIDFSKRIQDDSSNVANEDIVSLTGNNTITAQQLFDNNLIVQTNTGQITLPTAAQIVAGRKGFGLKSGEIITKDFLVTVAGTTITVVAGTGGTILGGANFASPLAGRGFSIIIRMTNVTVGAEAYVTYANYRTHSLSDMK